MGDYGTPPAVSGFCPCLRSSGHAYATRTFSVVAHHRIPHPDRITSDYPVRRQLAFKYTLPPCAGRLSEFGALLKSRTPPLTQNSAVFPAHFTLITDQIVPAQRTAPRRIALSFTDDSCRETLLTTIDLVYSSVYGSSLFFHTSSSTACFLCLVLDALAHDQAWAPA